MKLKHRILGGESNRRSSTEKVASSRKPVAIAVALALMSARAQTTELPLACVAGTCGIDPNTKMPYVWVASGSATATVTADTLRITQSSDTAVLNWSSFNVSADGHVIFQQPGASSIALNRIFQNSPSSILGRVDANGQIYLINPNGFIFGSTAKVNAAGILASTLSIRDSSFAQGLLSPIQNNLPALETPLDADGNPLPMGPITVQQGAQVASASGGRILLAAPNVTNAGSLSAPDGQVILAAADKVYLQSSSDPSLRGLLVEIGTGGTAWNQLTGEVDTPRGNVTMIGYAVNQDGRISATTSVAANGSVRLLARDSVQFTAQGVPSPTRTGTVTLGPKSSLSISPELQSTATAVKDQQQLLSSIEIVGRQITMQGGSSIVAPSANLSVTASADLLNPTVADSAARIRIDSGVNIDLSGSNVSLPMSSNLVSVELRANELSDSPDQRNSALRGQTIVVDARADGGKGTELANVTGAIDAIPQSVGQRTTAGGNAVFNSAGDIVVSSGATINVSGGSTTYQGGNIATTQLIASDGTVVDIGNADPSRVYVGIVNPAVTVKHDRWGVIETIAAPNIGHFEPTYEQGANAGKLSFAAPSLILNGTLLGHAVNGVYQRTASAMASGGVLTLGIPNASLDPITLLPDYRLSSVQVVEGSPNTAVSDEAALPLWLTTLLPLNDVLAGGFTQTVIASNGRIDVPAGNALHLLPGSSLSLSGQRIDIESNISSVGGKLAFNSVLTTGIRNFSITRPGVVIGAGVTLDVRGNWTNDTLAPPDAKPVSPLLSDGGSISAKLSDPTGGELIIGSDVNLRVSGGAWVNANGSLQGGSGGKITLSSAVSQLGGQGAFQIGDNINIDGFGVGTAQGGSLSLSVPRITIVNQSGAWESATRLDGTVGGVLNIGTPLFSDYGFTTIALNAVGARDLNSENVLTVDPGTRITAAQRSLVLQPGYLSQPTSNSVASFASIATLPQTTRHSTTTTLSGFPDLSVTPTTIGNVAIGAEAQLLSDPGSTYNITSVGSIEIAGNISALGGAINVRIAAPPSDLDPGFIADRVIDISETASLNVKGVAVIAPGDPTLIKGSVLAGGSISLAAERGSVIVRSGAQMDVSGTQSLLDLPDSSGKGYVRETVASAGGSVSVSASDSISLLGSLRAAAGVGDTGSAAGGSLTILLTQDQAKAELQPEFPVGPRVVRLTATTSSDISSPLDTTAFVNADFVAKSGVDALTLRSVDQVQFDGNMQLNLGRSLTIDAPTIGITNGSGVVNLFAPYVAFGNGSAFASTTSSTPGSAVLNISGNFFDLIGNSVLQGVSRANFLSSSDLRLRGTEQNSVSQGSFQVPGSLYLTAARVYPSTLTSFAISSASGGPNTVAIEQAAGAAHSSVPLSVGGSVTITAPDIEIGGSLLAPFGNISLQASDRLTLESGGIVSVSGAGALIPFGQVQAGQWTYTLNRNILVENSIPQRQVTLQAPAVQIAQGATVDISGGGDLYAYEWIPGTGGTSDALATGAASGLYAILPSLQEQFAPYDPQEYTGSNLQPGTSVYLSGMPGLAAGTYPLLPARYALLPGAMLVRAVAKNSDMPLGHTTSLPNGTLVVAGYFVASGTKLHDTRTTGFAVYPGSYARELANYQDHTATQFYSELTTRSGQLRPNLPADAGKLNLIVGSSLTARGSVMTVPTAGGRGARIDIVAPDLSVVASDAESSPGALEISADVLKAWNPSELVLGGTLAVDESTLDVASNSVTIRGGASVVFDDVLLAAASKIGIEAGATVASRSGVSGATPLLLSGTGEIALTGAASAQAAYLELSDLSYRLPTRAGTASGATGEVQVAQGAQVRSGGAVVMDAPGTIGFDGMLQAQGARVSFESGYVGFADATVANTVGVLITPDVQNALENARSVRLASTGSMQFDRNVTFASTTDARIQGITLQASSIDNGANGASSTFSAATITLRGNAVPPSFASSTQSPGTLTLNADRVEIDSGNLQTTGFALLEMNAAGDFAATGTGSLRASGNIIVSAARVVASSNVASSVQANGSLHVTSSNGVSDGLAPLGGALTLAAGTDVDIASAIVLPAGKLEINAGTDLTVHDGATLDVSGVTVSAGGRSAGANGGTLTLTSGGALNVQSAASLAATGADAGVISIYSGGVANVAGTLKGQSNAGARGGTFNLVAQQLLDFSSLNARLESSGFTEQRRIEVVSGDLKLDAGSRLTSRVVNLTSDFGVVDISGNIIAPSTDYRSSIQLYGAQGVTLESTARLIADVVGSGQRGGKVELGTSVGAVDIESGAVLSSKGNEQGILLVRVPYLNADPRLVAINNFAGDTSSLAGITVEPVISEAAFSSSAVQSDVQTVAQNAAGIVSRLQRTGGTPISVQPGVEVDVNGNVNIGAANLSTWHPTGMPLALTVRATGNVTLSGTISDGFTTTGTGTRAVLSVSSDPSSTLRFIAGADLASPDPLAVSRSAPTSDLTLGTNAIVRTGTGDLSLAASRDVVFGSGSSAYAAGLRAVASQSVSGTGIANFTTGGGDVTINASRNIVGSPVTQSPATWLIRGINKILDDTQVAHLIGFWGVDPGKFGWNVGAFGGGDVVVTAGGSISNLSAADADSAVAKDAFTLSRFGGGTMSLNAGGEFNSGYMYFAHGSGSIRAGDSLGSARTSSIGDVLGTVLAIGDAQIDIQARGTVSLETAFNPTVLVQTASTFNQRSSFFTYGDSSALAVQTDGGDILIYADPSRLSDLGLNRAGTPRFSLSIAPSSLRLRSLSGDVVEPSSALATLFPSDTGELDIWAYRDISGLNIRQSDGNSSGVPTPLNPLNAYSIGSEVTKGPSSARHIEDPEANQISAGRDILFSLLQTAKATQIGAGRDVIDVSLLGQNLNRTDVTRIIAGRDFIYDAEGNQSRVEVGGPGELEIMAGRQVDLGFSSGIATTGRLQNAQIPTTQGANLAVLAGVDASSIDWPAFMNSVVAASSDYQAQLIAYVGSQTGTKPGTFADALTSFDQLDSSTQRQFALNVFFKVLVQAGRDANTKPSTDFAAGYAAINALFLGSNAGVSSPTNPNPYTGDITLAFSRVYTLQGGTISLVAPGGLVNVGLANPPPTLAAKQASELGIVAQGSGDVRIFTDGDVLVNSSRVFTLAGGDIAIWSTHGNIDAGRGAKSAVSAPPPTVLVDSQGNVTLSFAGAVTGSGIRTILTDPDITPGNVDLIAPSGFVNAGDAGIGSAGNLNIAAQHVIGLDNIQVGGTATGVPPAVSGLGASLSGVSAAANSTSNAASDAATSSQEAAKSAAPMAQSALSWLEVFVVGLGEDACKQDDVECLKRQKTQ